MYVSMIYQSMRCVQQLTSLSSRDPHPAPTWLSLVPCNYSCGILWAFHSILSSMIQHRCLAFVQKMEHLRRGERTHSFRMHGPSFGNKIEQALCSFAFHVWAARSWARAGQGLQSATASPTAPQWPQESSEIYRERAARFTSLWQETRIRLYQCKLWSL